MPNSLHSHFIIKMLEKTYKGKAIPLQTKVCKGILSEGREKKILLINPPFERLLGKTISYPPLGLLYLATVLRDNKYIAKVYNADFELHLRTALSHPFTDDYSENKVWEKFDKRLNDLNFYVWEEIRQTIKKENSGIVGISFDTQSYKSAKNIAFLAKQINKNIIVIAGGWHPTALPEETIKEKDFDFVVVGEGELTLLELVDAISKNKNFNEIKGIFFKKKGIIFKTPPRELVKNLDKFPIPDRMLLMNNKELLPQEAGHIIASRGCPYYCSFCASHIVWGRKVRYRSPENILKEIKLLYYTFGTRDFIFYDDTFLSNISRVEKICGLIKKNRLKITWTCQTRIDTVNIDVLKLIKSAGCKVLCIGFESGDQKILNSMKKGISIKQVRKNVKLIKKLGFKILASFILGHPDETLDSLERTKKLALEINPDFLVSQFLVPLPGSEIYNHLKQKYAILDYNWSHYYFDNYNLINHPNVKSSDLVKYYKFFRKDGEKRKIMGVLSYYLNPIYLTKKVIQNIIYPKRLFLLILHFFKTIILIIKFSFVNFTHLGRKR